MYILINGEPTIELDYISLHPRILYYLIGAQCPTDPYIVDGYHPEMRKVFKLLFNTALNASTPEEAFKGFRHVAYKKGGVTGEYMRNE